MSKGIWRAAASVVVAGLSSETATPASAWTTLACESRDGSTLTVEFDESAGLVRVQDRTTVPGSFTPNIITFQLTVLGQSQLHRLYRTMGAMDVMGIPKNGQVETLLFRYRCVVAKPKF